MINLSSSSEELIKKVDLLKDYKEDILLVKLISSSIGINLKDEDITVNSRNI